MYTRQNVYANGGDLSDPILLWYARAVGEMQKLALDHPLSWAFYAAIHGIDLDLWPKLGLPVAPLPASELQLAFWKQCQHGSWYFLPWHRGYLLGLEGILRSHVVGLGGPADWALPYWDYFAPNENKLPPAFSRKTMPDGVTPNPLYVAARYGPANDGDVYVPLQGQNAVNVNSMNNPYFTGVASGGSPGFGGVDTGFAHSGATHGGIETQPHDWVHGLVGGSDSHSPDPDNPLPGLMSDPDTAGYDPIFWLHHANIDRLWQVWVLNPPQPIDPTPAPPGNPTDPNWTGGPASVGERVFAMPMADGSTWHYTPDDVLTPEQGGYTYADLKPPAAVPSPAERLAALGFEPAAAGAPRASVAQAGTSVELVGASDSPLPLVGAEARASVRVDPAARAKVTASLSAATDGAEPASPAPDRVFLNLENVTGNVDATAFYVYVGLAEDADPTGHPEFLAGNIALFGVRKASQPDGEHGGQGLTFVLEITRIVDRLHLDGALDVDRLPVRLVPVNPVPEGANVRIGRVSVYRQGR